MVFIICTKLIRKKNLSYNYTPQIMELYLTPYRQYSSQMICY